MKIRLAAPLQKESIADGQGVRIVIWNQGCLMNCPGCHNPETHSLCGGREIELSEVLAFIKENAPKHQGITLSGGDPFLQPEQNNQIAQFAHNLGLDVWAYCGKTYDQLLNNPLLQYIDILVDGPYIEAQRDLTLAFRGSANQRIIDVQKSLKENKIILWECQK